MYYDRSTCSSSFSGNGGGRHTCKCPRDCMRLDLVFKKEKEMTGMWRFKEVTQEGQPPKIDTHFLLIFVKNRKLYIKKYMLGNNVPSTVKLTVEW
jgi:hypothetical protein